MRVLAATIGALLISVSYPALAQERPGGPPQDESQQGDMAQTERRCEPLPAGMPQAWMNQDEGRQGEPEALPLQLSEQQLGEHETRRPAMPVEMPQVEPRQAGPEQTSAPPPEQAGDRSSMQGPAMAKEEIPERSPEERPAMRGLTTAADQLLAQLPERPAMQAPAMTAEELLAQLPERLPGERGMQRAATTARELLARLPDRRPGEQAETQPEELRQPEAMKVGMQDQPMEVAMPGDPRWAALNEPSLGTAMDLPRAVFSMDDGHAYGNMGRRYRTPDRRARVAVWTQRAASHDTPAGYLRRTFNIPRATVDYERFTPEFAAVSGVHGGRVYYIRCNLSSGGSLHCFDLAYPVREKKAWDVVVTRMSRSLRPLYY